MSGTLHPGRARQTQQIATDSRRYEPMWRDDPRSFIKETARLHPPIALVPTQLQQKTSVRVLGRKLTFNRGDPQALIIALQVTLFGSRVAGLIVASSAIAFCHSAHFSQELIVAL